MLKRTIGELQVELFNHLRMKQLYARLINVALERSDAFPCGWRADVVGDFTVTEHNENRSRSPTPIFASTRSL